MPTNQANGPSRGPTGSFEAHVGLARMLVGGVILDVTTADQARLAEDAGAAAVMALERVPADIRRDGGVARMASVERIRAIRAAVTLPVMAKARIGHFVEARVLEELGVDFIDESEVLTPADALYHVDKRGFRVPFVCGARNLGEALRRIAEGAALIRTKGEAGTGDVVEAVRHLRAIHGEMRALTVAPAEELVSRARDLGAPLELVRDVALSGRLPVPNFAAGGIATPADAALVMQLGAEAVFVGSGVFHSAEPARTAAAIVKATARHAEPAIVLAACAEAGAAMPGRAAASLPAEELLAVRGS
jgi:pyridoxal 5'-phosphate synthase pdxS subunit